MQNVTLFPADLNEKSSKLDSSYYKTLARYSDPLTLPHTKIECIHTTNPPWPGGPVLCDGWATFKRFLYVRPTLRAIHPTSEELEAAAEACLREPHIVAALSAMIAIAASSGGAAAAPAAKAFVDLFTSCVVTKLAGQLQAWVEWPSEWGNWEQV